MQLSEIGPSYLRELMDRAAAFERWNVRARDWKPVKPPPDIAQLISSGTRAGASPRRPESSRRRAAAALRCSRLLIECIHPVSAPPYGRREPRRDGAQSTKNVEHRFRWHVLEAGFFGSYFTPNSAKGG